MEGFRSGIALNVKRAGVDKLTDAEMQELTKLRQELPVIEGTYQLGGDTQFLLNPEHFERIENIGDMP